MRRRRRQLTGCGEPLAAAEQIEKPVETHFKLVDQWNRRLFTALCCAADTELKPYAGTRASAARRVAWFGRPGRSSIRRCGPNTFQIEKALHEYLNEATERIIREEVFGNSDEAEEQACDDDGRVTLRYSF